MLKEFNVSRYQGNHVAQEETYLFFDSLGRTVEIPKNLNRIVPFGVLGQIIMWPLAADEFVGLSRPLTNLETKYIDSKYASLPDIGSYFCRHNLNIAEIKKLNPQVVIDVGESKKGMASQLDNIQDQLGIPVIHIEASINTMPQAYRTLGDLFNKQTKAEELATYCEKVLENTDSIIMQAEMFGKKSLVYCLGNDGLNVLAQGTFHTEIIDKLADNLAVVPNPSSKGTGNPIKMTDLQGWNPEVILFGPDSIYSTVHTNPAWQNLQAIKGSTYYEVPNGPYNWLGMPPSVNRYIGMIWLCNILYPELSSDISDVIEEDPLLNDIIVEGQRPYNLDYDSYTYLSKYNRFHQDYNGKDSNPPAQCTWHCYGRAYEMLGKTIQFDGTGGLNGGAWWTRAKGYSKGQTPKVNSIAVWVKLKKDGTEPDPQKGEIVEGHVAYVEKVDGEDVYISEANYYDHFDVLDSTDGTVRKPTRSRIKNHCGAGFTFKGYIYL